MSRKKNDDGPKFIPEMKAYPVIRDQEEFARLIERWRTHGDRRAYNQLVYSNIGLVLLVANRFASRGIAFSDLVQEGLIGLMRALETFDPQQAAFSTYAAWWLFQAMTRVIADKARTIRISVHVWEKMSLIRRSIVNFYSQTGCRPDDQQIYALVHALDNTDAGTAAAKELTLQDIKSYRPLVSLREYSLQHKLFSTEEDSTLGDVLADTSVNIETGVEASLLQKAALKSVLYRTKRSPRALTILRLRFNSEATLTQVGNHLGLSRERVRQIENKLVYDIARDLKTTEDGVREILTWLSLGTEKPNTTQRDVSKEEVDTLFRLLCRHILETSTGVRIVKEPRRTLEIRKNLLPYEAEAALEKMRAANLVEGQSPWTLLRVVPEVAIPTFNPGRWR